MSPASAICALGCAAMAVLMLCIGEPDAAGPYIAALAVITALARR